MGKLLSTIIVVGLTAAGYVVGGPLGAAIGTVAGQLVSNALLAPNAPKPDTTETAIKTPRPPRVGAYGESRLFGAQEIYETNASGTAVDVFAVHDGQLTEIVQRYLNDDKVTITGDTVVAGADGRYGGGKVKFYTTDGSNPGAGIPALSTALPGIWDANRRGDGVVLIGTTCDAVKAKKFLDVYPNGVPVASIAAKWQKCPDPSAEDPTNEAGWTYTENPIRQLLHYKLKREGVDYATKIAPTIGYWVAAAAVCDEEIVLKAGGTEARYRSCVAHKLTDPHKQVATAILQTCDGWIAPRSDGSLIVFAGKYDAPTIDVGPDEIIAFEWDGVGVDDDKAINEITCSYVSAAHDYNTVDTDPWTAEDDIAERGQVLSEELSLQVPSHGQIRRLAKRKQARNLAKNRGTITTNIAGRSVRGQRYINLSLKEAGALFFEGVVEITSLSRNLSTGGVTFTWVEVDPNMDVWNPATEEGDPAPVGNRIAPQPVDAPEITDTTAVLAPDGGSAQIQLDVDAPDREDLTWFARWKLSADSIWNEQEYSDIDSGASVSLLVGLVPADASVDVAAAYQVGDGRVSPWSATETVSTSTAALAPASPSEVSAANGVGEADVTWRNPPSANLSYLKVFRNTTATFGTASAITGELVGGLAEVMSITDTGLAAGTYYYWVVAYNAGDIASAPAGPDSATVT